jgi:hypothetical protein
VVANSLDLCPGPAGVCKVVSASFMLGFAHLMLSSTDMVPAHSPLAQH